MRIAVRASIGYSGTGTIVCETDAELLAAVKEALQWNPICRLERLQVGAVPQPDPPRKTLGPEDCEVCKGPCQGH